jgi:hypothetical protein
LARINEYSFLVPGMVLGQRILVADVRVVDAVQGHVHAADSQHGVVEVVAVEHAIVKMLPSLGVTQDFRVLLAQILPGNHQEAAGAAGRVADDVFGGRRHQLDHQPDDVPRGAELAVLPGAGNLAQHVLVEVALGVPVLHGHVVEHIHHFRQQGRRRDGEAGILHVVRVGGAVATHGTQKGEYVFAD